MLFADILLAGLYQSTDERREKMIINRRGAETQRIITGKRDE